MDNKENEHNASVHAGHRKRMLAKYNKFGADAFETHKLIEMLLYYSVFRKNTNEIAHNVVNQSKAFPTFFSAKVNALDGIKGFGNKSLQLIQLCRDCIRRCELEHSAITPLDSSFKRTRFIYNWFKGKSAGTVMAMFLDERLMLKDCTILSAGRMFRPESYPDIVLEKAISLNAKHVIVSHSHRDNCREPSPEDLYLAGQIRASLGSHGIELINQYIVTEFDCTPTNNFNI